MTDVLLRRGRVGCRDTLSGDALKTEMRGERHVEKEIEGCGCKPGAPRPASNLGKPGRVRKDPPQSLREGGGSGGRETAGPCPHPDFRRLASRTMRSNFCCCEPPVCPSSSRTQPQSPALLGPCRAGTDPSGAWLEAQPLRSGRSPSLSFPI